MTHLTDRRLLTAAALCLVGAVAGCGGGGGDDSPDAKAAPAAKVPPGAVAVVAGTTISQASYDHWLDITRREAKVGDSSPDQKAIGKQALTTLVRGSWADGEAAKEGIAVTPAELDAAYRKASKLTYAGNRTFAQYRKQMDLNKADILFRLRVAAINQKLTEKVQAKAGGAGAADADQQVRDFTSDYAKRWKAQTTCRSDLTTADCSNAS